MDSSPIIQYSAFMGLISLNWNVHSHRYVCLLDDDNKSKPTNYDNQLQTRNYEKHRQACPV